MSKMNALVVAAAGLVLVASTASAALTVNYVDPHSTGKSGQVNISGATLFKSFFESKVSTHDDSDADDDGLTGYMPANPPSTRVDQLAVDPTNPLSTFWLVQYRGTGSGNGLAEFVDYQLSANHTGVVPWDPNQTFPIIPWSYTPDPSYINRLEYASGGVPTATGFGVESPQGDYTGTPVQQEGVDLAVMDVPTTWFATVAPASAGAWNAAPTSPGYGYAGIYDKGRAKFDELKSIVRMLPSDTANANSPLIEYTLPLSQITDTPIAWVPIAFLANRGTGIEQLKVTELWHLYLTGRAATGENINVVTRDSGSGTRNGAMNSIGIDPAWGRGDGRDPKHETKPEGYLGDTIMWTNKASSSRLEDTVTNLRLALGYTGLMDDSKAADHFYDGNFEIVDIMFDDRGGTQYVRPSVETCIVTGDPDTGYQVGGPETFASGPATSAAAQAYLDNITISIANFAGSPPTDPNFLTPAEDLASKFILNGALDYEPNLVNPTEWIPNGDVAPGQNIALKNWQLANTVLTPNGSSVIGYGADELAPYGSVNDAGQTPRRNASAVAYSDGSTNGDYIDAWGGIWTRGTDLPSNCALTGDFNLDGVRNAADIPAMMDAIADQNVWPTTVSTSANPVMPAIIGDFDGNGSFDAADIRFFADGLALDPTTGLLNRCAGFTAVDTEWAAATGTPYFAATTWANGATYVAGDARFDVAGSAAAPTPGAEPTGHDGVIGIEDAEYIEANTGDWADLDDALYMDLSCDTNGDLVVDACDSQPIRIKAGLPLIGDANCDGIVDTYDIDAFVAALTGEANWEAYLTANGIAICDFVLANDCNLDGIVDTYDIDAFIQLLGGCPTCP